MVPRSENENVDVLSDRTLANWLSSNGSQDAAEYALGVFTSILDNASLPVDVRITGARNAYHVAVTRDGSLQSPPYSNFDQAFEFQMRVQDFHRQGIHEAMSSLHFRSTHGEKLPLTTFDLDFNAKICTDSGFMPRARFVCGSKNEVGWSGPSSSESSAARLYLGLLKRTLTNFIFDESRDYADIISGTKLPISCEDAGGTACEFPYGLTFRGFGLAASNFSRSSSKAHTSLSVASLTHLELCIERVITSDVKGDLIEAGVFRGGATIFMMAALISHRDLSRRVFVADSFSGIPLSRGSGSPVGKEECDSWSERYAVSEAEVK